MSSDLLNVIQIKVNGIWQDSDKQVELYKVYCFLHELEETGIAERGLPSNSTFKDFPRLNYCTTYMSYLSLNEIMDLTSVLDETKKEINEIAKSGELRMIIGVM